MRECPAVVQLTDLLLRFQKLHHDLFGIAEDLALIFIVLEGILTHESHVVRELLECIVCSSDHPLLRSVSKAGSGDLESSAYFYLLYREGILDGLVVICEILSVGQPQEDARDLSSTPAKRVLAKDSPVTPRDSLSGFRFLDRLDHRLYLLINRRSVPHVGPPFPC